MTEPLLPLNDLDIDIRFHRRDTRQYSRINNPRKENTYNKFIIPYNFEQGKYFIPSSEIEFFDEKNYLLKTIEKLNNNNISFHLGKKFKASLKKQLYLYVPTILISLIGLYLSFIILILFSLNPVFIYFFFIIASKCYKLFKYTKDLLMEKFKMQEINNCLEYENKSELCRTKRFEWNLGENGYWLELKKKEY